MIGREDWLEDARFKDPKERKQNAAELVEDLEEELKKRTAIEWETILQSNGVPSARLRSMAEALHSDQLETRGFVQTLDDGLAIPTLPFRLGGIEAYKPCSHAPEKGEHNQQIIEWLNNTQ